MVDRAFVLSGVILADAQEHQEKVKAALTVKGDGKNWAMDSVLSVEGEAQLGEIVAGRWIIGPADFAKARFKENQELVGHGCRMAAEFKETKEALWQEELTALMRKLRRTSNDLMKTKKSASGKVALAATMKTRSTATNRWRGEALNMGGLTARLRAELANYFMDRPHGGRD